MSETIPPDSDNLAAEELEPTTAAVLAADAAHRDEAMASVRWERHGILQRLTKH